MPHISSTLPKQLRVFLLSTSLISPKRFWSTFEGFSYTLQGSETEQWKVLWRKRLCHWCPLSPFGGTGVGPSPAARCLWRALQTAWDLSVEKRASLISDARQEVTCKCKRIAPCMSFSPASCSRCRRRYWIYQTWKQTIRFKVTHNGSPPDPEEGG